MIITCLTESSKLVPYIIGHRKALKSYLKACLGLWSGPSISVDKSEDADEDEELANDADKVRIAAFLSIRKAAMGSDESLLDMVLKVSFWSYMFSFYFL
jgi:nucleolar complex protein 2